MEDSELIKVEPEVDSVLLKKEAEEEEERVKVKRSSEHLTLPSFHIPAFAKTEQPYGYFPYDMTYSRVVNFDLTTPGSRGEPMYIKPICRELAAISTTYPADYYRLRRMSNVSDEYKMECSEQLPNKEFEQKLRHVSHLERRQRTRTIETEERRRARLAAAAERERRRRASETEEQRQARREANARRTRLRRAMEAEDQRRARLEANAQRARIRRAAKVAKLAYSETFGPVYCAVQHSLQC